ncbi:MAG: SDR family NAD(P)-dependent oxidoreductase [Candidatus Schekmanbacteria bacterium]|nr:SDR family NAD(P)-dependent oxidoreductase [Candidatus Schekmanbacteria bacterium]
MKTVVVTGSTKGIGLGLAKEFLKRECSVTLSGRNKEKLEDEVKKLSKEFGQDRVLGQSCDVTDINEVRTLWNSAKQKFGKIDIWINNAGRDTNSKVLWELDPAEIAPTVNTNITGLIYGTMVALKGMLEQGSGQIYSMEGFGSSDMMRPGLTVYGTTKRAVRYFTESMIEETNDKPVQIGTLSPGMVITDFLLNNLKKMPEEKRAEVKLIYNMLADKVETVTEFLASEVLKNDKTGAKIEWLTSEKAMERMNSDEYINRDLLSEFGV